MTALQGGSGNVKLQRFDTAGPLNSYTHEITVTLGPFFLAGSGETQSDFKWKTFGPDGFMEIVLNSFGDMRLYHNDPDRGAGNIQPNTTIGMADGDVLNLTTVYGPRDGYHRRYIFSQCQSGCSFLFRRWHRWPDRRPHLEFH